MKYPVTNNIPFGEIGNGALVLLLLQQCKTWEELCGRYRGANPALLHDTATMNLRDKLAELRKLGLVAFEDEETPAGMKPVGEIKDTGLWPRIRVSFGGMSMSEVAMISRHSNGMAVMPAFGRPRKIEDKEEKIDVFVLMPFKTRMKSLYTKHIRKMGEEMGLTIQRADDIFAPDRPFMQKVWDGICAAQLVLADCTENNPNVFYEIGIAHTVGKTVLLITRNKRDIPADIRQFDVVPYVYDPKGVEKLVKKLRAFLESRFKLRRDAKNVSS